MELVFYLVIKLFFYIHTTETLSVPTQNKSTLPFKISNFFNLIQNWIDLKFIFINLPNPS